MLNPEAQRISTVGLVARSPEGHAAKGMQIKGNEDLWIEIQAHTFKNWVNEHLRPLGLQVNDLTSDLCDGTKLVALVEALQKRTLRKIHNPNNQHQMLENVSRALDAISADGVKLVNIGNVDIVNGNLKLILGLIWSLIVRYQIGRSKFPPKKLMLAWLRSVLPETEINNFTTDWNSGINLSALVDYCRPGLIPHWRNLDPNDKERNCRVAMTIAKKELGVPTVLDPEYLSSPHLDELSGMTYVSYFMKENGPGYKATMNWVRNQLPERHISNFTTDWNNGQLLCELVRSLGGPLPGMDTMSTEQDHWETNLTMGMKGGDKLGITSILRPKDMADPSVDHLGVMAYTAAFQWLPKRPPPGQRLSVSMDSDKFRKGVPVTFSINFHDEQLEHSEITVEVKGPSERVDCRLNFHSKDGKGTFIATEIGIHEVVVKYQGEPIKNSPLKCRILPPISKISYTTGLEPCAVGSVVEVSVNPQDTSPSGAKLEFMEVFALSPSGFKMPCPVNNVDGGFAATFKPDEPGEWNITILYKNKEIQGSPFPCFVFDPNGVKLDTLEGALPGLPFGFICDSRGTGGLGEIDIDITHEGRSIPYNTEYIADGVTRILLPVLRGGKHRVHVYFNGIEIRGSPFSLRVGSSRSRRQHGVTSSHGKTRSYDKDDHGILSSSILSQHQKGSASFDETTMKKHSSILHESMTNDTVDAAHHRFKHYGTKLSTPSPIPGSRENLSSPRPKDPTYITSAKYNVAASNSLSSSKLEHTSTSNFMEDKTYSRSHLTSTSPGLNGRGSVSPFLGDIVVDGDGLGIVPIHSQATITVSSEYGETPLENLTVDVTSPNGVRVPVRVIDSGSSISAKFSPAEVGEHLIDISISGRPINGSPFRSAIFNPEAIKVTRVPKGYVGRPVEIEIDGRGAGPGHLAILVDGGRVTSQVKALGDHRFRAVFLPHDSGIHSVDMTFNGITVPGSPWRVNVLEPSMDSENQPGNESTSEYLLIKGDPVRHIRYGQNASFEISAPGFTREAIDVNVLSPSRKALSYRLHEEGPGNFTLEFTPSDVGTHLVEVLVAGRRLSVVAKVYNPSLIKVLDVSPGVIGQTTQFKVDASQAGEGQLEISVNDGELPNQVRVLGGGCCLVSFTPEFSKPHAIDIKFNGETIPDCPIICEIGSSKQVAVSLSGLELIPVHQVSRFQIAVDGSSSAELAVSVKGPTGDLPVKVSGSVRSGFTAEFTAREVGAHQITVNHNGVPASGTPFTAKAYDAKRVYVSPIPRGALGRSIQFTVDASQSGEGNLEITISAKGKNVPTQVHPQGGARFGVSFIPEIPADHTIIVTFNKQDVPGSPYLASVSTDPGQIIVTGPNLSSAHVGKTAQFSLNNVHGSLEDVEVEVEGPTGNNLIANITDKTKNTYGVEFVPEVVGEHRILVKWKKVPVPGSPFACKVYNLDAIKVQNTESGIIGKPVTFLVHTSEAGPGNLEVTVNSGQVATTAQAQGSHTYAISFTPKESKPHMIELKFNSEDIPGSPFCCEMMDPSKVIVSGDLEKVPVGKRATFLIESVAGMPEVKILGPMKQPIHSSIQVPSENNYLVEYVPVDVGDHTVDVSVAGVPVPGSPFIVKSFDSSKVKIIDISPGIRGKLVYFSIDASSAGAGNLEIIVSVGGRNVPNYVQAEGNAKFRVNFRATELAPHTLSVRFNGENITGSPLTIKIIEKSQIVVSGNGLKSAAVNQPATITIDPQGSELDSCKVSILSPSGIDLPVNICKNPDEFKVLYTPTEVGPHSISILVDGDAVPNSPFSCNVFDKDKVRVTGLEDGGRLGEPKQFSVDASEAGEGTLELVVTTQQQSLRAEVSARSRGLYDVTFIPQETTIHFVNITFNDLDIPGNPFEIYIEDTYAGIANDGLELESLTLNENSISKVPGMLTSGLDAVIAGTNAFIDLEKKGTEMPVVIVHGPENSGNIKVHNRTLPSGLLRYEFTCDRVGTYNIAVKEGSKELVFTEPLQAKVFDPLLARIKDKNDTAVLGQDYSFKVEVSRSGMDSEDSDILEAIVKAGVEEVSCYKRYLGNGVYGFNFKPEIPIPHRVYVLCHGFSIKGCPFDLPVVESGVAAKDTVVTGPGLYLGRVGRSAGFSILTKGSSGRDFDVVVSGPGGVAVPVRCYQQRDQNLRAEFAANKTGDHEIAVYHRSKQVKGSPFKCHIYDPQKVLIGNIPTQITIGQSVLLPIDLSESGNALLEAEITGPEGLAKPVFPTMDERHGDYALKFIPKRPGKYKVMLNFGGEPVPGCPVTIQAEEAGAAKADGAGLYHGHVGQPAVFKVHGPGIPGIPVVSVEGPDSVAKCEIKRLSLPSDESGHFNCSYIPTEVGVFDLRVLLANIDIPGSPFHPRVVDSNKLRVIGGWEAHLDESNSIQLALGEERKISFNTLDAGPGFLEAKLSPVDPQPGFNSDEHCRIETAAARSKLFLSLNKPGEYNLSLKWGSFEIEDSPKTIFVNGVQSGELEGPVVLTGQGLSTARCGDESHFTIDASQAGMGTALVTLHHTDMNVPIPVNLIPIGGGVFKGTYMARIPGTYQLSVSWGGRVVQGCPMTVIVGTSGDATNVVCSGEGLHLGTVGKDIRSFIDTRKAGPGELTAQCMGPRKTAYCELYDHGDGTFTLNIRPQEAGKHQLNIKYSGEHVPGSPFPLKIVGLPDASKVKVYGPGIEHGVLPTFQSRFLVDTRGAGAGQLTVRVRGPKGAFRVEMQRESQKDRTILCKYDPTEPGDYRVEVRWAGEHVRGSPFSVMIFDTQEELHHFIQGGPSPLNGTQSDFYGSTTYSVGPMSWKGSQAQL